MENLIVSASPHIHIKDTTQSIMRDVLIALCPAAIASVVLFGLKALWIIAVCVCSAVLSELLFNIVCKKAQTVNDLSAIVTGLLLALSLPAKTALWQCAVGAVFAIVVIKCLFGGIGYNFANPAITARVVMLIAFAGTMTTWTTPAFADAVSGATPLAQLGAGENVSLMSLFLGTVGGSMGETSALALLIGFVYSCKSGWS